MGNDADWLCGTKILLGSLNRERIGTHTSLISGCVSHYRVPRNNTSDVTKIPFLLCTPSAQDTPPVLRVSSHLLGCRLVFRRLPFLNHRHYRRCCHLKFAGGFFCVVPLHSNTCIISLCFYWFFYCIGFIITFPFLYLLMVLQYNPRRVFWFLCAGSLLDLFFVFLACTG